MSKTTLFTIILSVLPISELRGAIPYAYFNGMSLMYSCIVSVIANIMIVPLGYFFFGIVDKILFRIEFFRNFAEKRAKRVSTKFNKYGYLGLTLFVAVPLPVTGAWTSVLGTWLLGLDKKKSSLAIASGVLLAGIIVCIVIFTGSELAAVFTKTINL